MQINYSLINCADVLKQASCHLVGLTDKLLGNICYGFYCETSLKFDIEDINFLITQLKNTIGLEEEEIQCICEALSQKVGHCSLCPEFESSYQVEYLDGHQAFIESTPDCIISLPWDCEECIETLQDLETLCRIVEYNEETTKLCNIAYDSVTVKVTTSDVLTEMISSKNLSNNLTVSEIEEKLLSGDIKSIISDIENQNL
jgi:hypothetical protein